MTDGGITRALRFEEIEVALLTEIRDLLKAQQGVVSSVELSMNAKGKTQPSVKAYHPDIEQAAKQAQTIYDDLIRDNQTPAEIS